MLIDFSKPINSYRIQILDNGKPVLLALVAQSVLTARHVQETNPQTGASTLSGEEQYKRYVLAQKVSAGDEVDVSAEEIALIKKLVGYGNFEHNAVDIIGAFYQAIEGSKPQPVSKVS